MKAHIYYGLFTLALLISVSACSNNSAMPAAITDGSTVLDPRTLFANNAELDYAAKAEDYRIGIADLLEISVFRAEEFSKQARVDSNGMISLPLLGNVRAEGLTPVALEQHLAKLLMQKYLQDPQVTVFVKEYNSQKITLDGAFNTPGVYPITAGQIDLLQALALGRGLDSIADPSKVVLFRKMNDQTKAYRLDVDAIRLGKAKVPYLRNNDILIAHRSDSRYWLREVAGAMGNVRTILRPF